MESPLPANARVTVQCTDPSGIFSTFEPLLSQRLPLHNLHWKSPNRPLRAINSLHVALEHAKYGQTEAQPNERRHQIPGLRQTPYLKIYLLRCDDKETYKSICRKQVREWIKSETQSPENKSSSSQESHDAFEYLIVHVVLPNTPAASEPRVSKNAALENASLGPTDSSDSINSNSKSKWPGKGSSTVYDKIRADFNGSSKAILERVAQVRIVKDGPAQPVTSPSSGPSELEEQWHDLIEKLKVSILSSFDRRVRQYEADIRERDSQRHLPGWNFCTFFILKEGLARGFESVGLLEDALVGYDELAVGLDVIVREEAAQEDDGQSATFLPFSKDLKSKIRNVIDGPQKTGSVPAEAEEWLAADDAFLQLDESMYPLDQRKKPYRELILSNDISVFDLRMYIFTRQEELLLRRATLSWDTTQTASNAGIATTVPYQEESFLNLAQICQRAVDFLNLGAQTLRQELYRAWGGHDSQDLTHMKFQRSLIDNIVSSWVYCAAIQVLIQTSNPTLVMSTQSFPKAWPRSSGASSSPSKARRSKHITASSDESHEHHTSQPKPSGQELILPTSYTNGLWSSQLQTEPPSEQSDQSKVKKAGTQELASWRAALYLLARRTIAGLGRRHDWIPDRNRMGGLSTVLSSSNFEELSLQNEKDATKTLSNSEVSQSTSLGLEPLLVERAANSQELFSKLYESLTYQAYGHFISAGNLKSASCMLTDMALLKYQQGDYESAASYFEHIAEDGSTDMWTVLHGSMLELYADCLKRLKRVSPYLRVVLRILAMYAADRRPKDGAVESSQAAQALIDDLCQLSADLDDQIVVPMNDFIQVTGRDLRVCHHHGRDGFYIPLSICNLLGTTLNISNGMKMILTARDGPQAALELRTNESIKLMATPTEIVVESNVTTTGWYEPRRVEMAIGNIVFLEECGANKSSQPSMLGVNLTQMRPFDHPILLYPAVDAFQARAKPPPRICLPQSRSMLIELRSGWNDVLECTLRLKAATAGLRLQVRKAVLLDNTAPKGVILREGTDNQSISLSNFFAGSLCSISVPYTLETADTTSLVARVEITYETKHGSYRHLNTLSISTILPIKVNVEDMFHESPMTSRAKIALTSRLTISPATLVPLRVEKCDIAGSEAFDVESGAAHASPMDVFPKQPASLVYRFTRRRPLESTAKEQPPRVLIDFHCLDQVVLSAIEQQFLEDIAKSHCAKLARLLSAHLLSQLSSQWTQEDLEVACLLQEIEIWPYEEIGWDAICAGLPRETRSEAEQWLRNWHQGHLSISLTHTEATKRQINIPVEIPAPRILVTIDLALANVDQGRLPIAIGQPLAAILKVRHTGGWEEGPMDVQSNAIEFSYEVIASPDMWLVGGRRRGNFTVDLTEQAFPVLLIPQRAGHLLLPSVEVMCNTLNGDNSRAVLPKPQIAYEVNYKSQAKSVLVIPNLCETTISLDTESAAGKSLLVDSRRRQAEQ